MNWFACIIYGLAMGFVEFIPVSSGAQGQILQEIFGATKPDPVRDLVVHIFSLSAFFFVWRNPLETFRQDRRMIQRGTRSNNQMYRGNADSRFVRSAVLPMLICMVLALYFNGNRGLPSTAILLLLGGVVLYIPERLLQGNKSARSMSALDAVLIGVASALGAIPGLSRIGMGISVSIMRGADRKHALNWAYLLSVSALILMTLGDLFNLIASPSGIFLCTGFGGYLLMAIFSFAGAYLSVFTMRNVIVHRGLHAFAYYSWGAALFAFILYLL